MKAAPRSRPHPAQAQGNDFSKVEIQTIQLNDSACPLMGAGGNIGLTVGEDAVFIIDDQFARLAPKIKAAVASITAKPVQFLLNTHFHFDHTGGNLIVHFRQGDIVHMGDTFCNGFYPFIDVTRGGSAEGMVVVVVVVVVAAADRVLALAGDKTRIIPGHGPLATKADLQARRDMLAAVTQRIRDLRRRGQTDAQMHAAKPSADFDARCCCGFIKPEAFVQMMLDASPR